MLRISIRIFVQAGSATIQLKRPGLMSLGIISLMFLAELLWEVVEGCQMLSSKVYVAWFSLNILIWCEVRRHRRSFHLRFRSIATYSNSTLCLRSRLLAWTHRGCSHLSRGPLEWSRHFELRNMSCSRTNRRTTTPCHGCTSETWHRVLRNRSSSSPVHRWSSMRPWFSGDLWWRILELGSIHWFMVVFCT